MADIPLARRDDIAARLAAGQPVNSGVLATEFGVSEDAIRRDLRALAAAGLCRRVYGGALPLASGVVPFSDRLGADVERKRALARAAMPLVAPGSFLFLPLPWPLPPPCVAAASCANASALSGSDSRTASALMIPGSIGLFLSRVARS